jgi:tetratricopeptide (TPR) repeat protein
MLVTRCFASVLLTIVLLTASRSISQVSEINDLERAAALLKAGDMKNAREAYESILIRAPGSLSAHEGEVACRERLALMARADGNLDGALRDLLRARDFAPRNARLQYDLGVLEEEMQLYKGAETSLEFAEELHPQDSLVLYASARVKMDLGQLGAAEKEMIAYLKIHPDDASAHYGLGRVYQLGVQYDKARVEFQRSIVLEAVQTEGYYQLGDMALQEGSFDEAIANFEKTLSRNPEHGCALAGLGETYFKEKKYEKALEYLQHAIAAASDHQTGHYYLGLTLGRLGKPEESQHELEIAKNLADAENMKSSNRRQLSASVRTANRKIIEIPADLPCRTANYWGSSGAIPGVDCHPNRWV